MSAHKEKPSDIPLEYVLEHLQDFSLDSYVQLEDGTEIISIRYWNKPINYTLSAPERM